jgi:hypothetical protein
LVDEGTVLALSIRQPFAELILRGIKTVEYRSRPTPCFSRRMPELSRPLRGKDERPGIRVHPRSSAVPMIEACSRAEHPPHPQAGRRRDGVRA